MAILRGSLAVSGAGATVPVPIPSKLLLGGALPSRARVPSLLGRYSEPFRLRGWIGRRLIHFFSAPADIASGRINEHVLSVSNGSTLPSRWEPVVLTQSARKRRDFLVSLARRETMIDLCPAESVVGQRRYPSIE